MKECIKNYRFWALTALTAVAMICLLGEPSANALIGWAATLVISKAIGAAVALLAVRLFIFWAGRGEIECLTKLMKEE